MPHFVKTAAVYQETANGVVRLGTIRGKSLRDMAIKFHSNHPRAIDGGALFLAPRMRLMGRWVDGERLPMENYRDSDDDDDDDDATS